MHTITTKDTGMAKIKSLVAAGAVTAGLMMAPITASPARAESTYTLSYIGFCYTVSQEGCDIGNVSMNVTTTYSYDQIWINGHVDCTHGGGWVITWCSNTNNGKSYLNVGMNWTGTPQSGIKNGGSSWERMNILANGAGCSPWGGYAGPTAREEYGCQEEYSGPPS
jgi:hypothetical protein